MKSNSFSLAACAALLATSIAVAAGCAESSSELGGQPDGGLASADASLPGADANLPLDAATGSPDAPPPIAQVHLSATGVSSGVSVMLTAQGAIQSMTVSANGESAFPAMLPGGTPFALELGNGQPCLLGETGGIVGVDGPVALICDGVAALAELNVDSLAGLSPPFDPEVFAYTTEVSSLVEKLAVAARVTNGTATVSVAGVGPAAEVESSVDLATTPTVAVVVTHPSGLARTYTVGVPAEVQLAERRKQTEVSPADGNFYGQAVAASAGYLAVGSTRSKDGNGVETGAVFVYRYGMSGLVLESILRPANSHADAGFGDAIAMDNQVLVVGVPRDSSSGVGINPPLGGASFVRSGAVEVFRRQSDGSWLRIARIKSLQPKPDELFGTSVDVGNETIVVGVPSNDTPPQPSTTLGITYSDIGNAFVYRVNGSIVTGETLVRPVQLRNFHRFGHSVAVDGDSIFIGAPGDRSLSATPGDTSSNATGAAWVYAYQNNAWRWTAYLKAATPEANGMFGNALAVDGDTLAVGEPGATGLPYAVGVSPPSGVGSVSLYKRIAGQWYPVGALTPGPQRNSIAFGSSLAVHHDRIAVGAPFSWSGGSGVDPISAGGLIFHSGAAYLFDTESRDLLHVIKSSDPTEAAYFGHAIAMSSHGLAASAPAANGSIEYPGPGAVYLFQ